MHVSACFGVPRLITAAWHISRYMMTLVYNHINELSSGARGPPGCHQRMRGVSWGQSAENNIYYMDKGILLATKTLVESIRHYIRDPSGVFSVCHAREWYTMVVYR